MEIKYLLYEITKISLVTLIAYTSYFYYKYFTRENPLPGPFPLPFIGNFHQILKNFTLDANKLLKYGDVCEAYMASHRFILLNNEELIQPMMKPVVSFLNRVKDDHEGLIDGGLYNVSLLFNNNYNEWQYYRKFFNKVMMSPSFIKQSVIAVQNSFFEMEKYWEKLGEDTILELNHWSKQYFFDTIFFSTTNIPTYAFVNYYNKVTPNRKLPMPESILKDSSVFLKTLDIFIYSFFRNTLDIFIYSFSYFYFVPRFIRRFPGINRYTKYFKDNNDWLENNILDIIKSKREEIEKTPIDQKLKSDMLTMYLTVNTERDVTERIADDLHDKPMSDKDIAKNFMQVMAGGIDTTSNSMCFLVYYLENHPKVKQRMREEIERVIGKDPNSLFTAEDISKLEYVEAVIKEVARIHPLSLLNIKKNSVPEVVAGYKWSKDTMFVLNVDRIHHHELNWKDPEVFNPDRFMDKNNPESKNQVYMFGGGLRICPGKNLAMMQLKATLVMLYRKYDIQLMGPLKDSIKSIRVCDELKVKVKKRKNL